VALKTKERRKDGQGRGSPRPAPAIKDIYEELCPLEAPRGRRRSREFYQAFRRIVELCGKEVHTKKILVYEAAMKEILEPIYQRRGEDGHYGNRRS